MKQITVAIILLLISMACKESNSSNTSNQDGIHQVICKEVLQTSQYTYILASQDNEDQWLAITSMQVEIGSTYYYKDGLVMTNFHSKELDREFDKIIFIDDFFSEAPTGDIAPKDNGLTHTASVSLEKSEISVTIAKGGISIAELYSKKEAYSGKKVKISGKVVKFNPSIMGKNWIHIQDGTEHDGQFDLTVTTDVTVNIGDTVTFEGVIYLDKDFGYGYFYPVIMEEGKIVN